MNKQKWQHEHFLNAFFTNSQRPVVDCLNVAAGILARSQWVIEGTGADQRFEKNAFKNAECHFAYSWSFFFFYLYPIQQNTTYKSFPVSIS